MDEISFRGIKEDLRQEVIEELNFFKEITDEEVERTIDNCILRYSLDHYIPLKEKISLRKELFNSVRRLDVLSELMEDDEISEIMINGPSDIFIEKAGEIIRTDKFFENGEKLLSVVQNMVSEANRTVNDKSPIVDVVLSDGDRVNVVLDGVSLDGTCVTIRKFSKNRIRMEDMIKNGTLSQEVASFLRLLVMGKYNIFISGGTSSGKTTFLGALTEYVGANERIITIEDSAELKISPKISNLVRMETRNANSAGENQITIRDLIKSSLRMRPERIIVGEVRGEEVIDMLTAMNTGHDGSLSTGHGNSVEDMLVRLETMILTSHDFPLEAVRRQIASGIDIIIHLERMRDRKRRVCSICEIAGVDGGGFVINPLYRFVEEDDDIGCVGSKDTNVPEGKERMDKGLTDKKSGEFSQDADDIGFDEMEFDEKIAEFLNSENRVISGSWQKVNDLINVSKLKSQGLMRVYREGKSDSEGRGLEIQDRENRSRENRSRENRDKENRDRENIDRESRDSRDNGDNRDRESQDDVIIGSEALCR